MTVRVALHRRPLLLGLLLLSLSASACGRVFEYPVTHSEDGAATCSDGLDNDLDGLADCYDPGCASFCRENDKVTCSDGLDNDDDGLLDCRDPDCAKLCRESSATACSDGLDNDLDGAVDCRDSDCADYCRENTDVACNNGLDDDFDSLVDCADPDCDGRCPEESAEACADGRDNDGDTLVDGADPRCWLLEPPHVQRCSAPDIDFRERFDDAFFFAKGAAATDQVEGLFDARWTVFGKVRDASDTLKAAVIASPRFEAPQSPYSSAGRTDLAATFRVAGRMVSKQVFAGSWSDLELSFAASINEGSDVEVALVPLALTRDYGATPGDRNGASVAIALKGSSRPPSFELSVDGNAVSKPLLLAPFEACGDYACDNGWLNVHVTVENGGLQALVEGAGQSFSLASAPLAGSSLAASALVLTGNSSSIDRLARLDDLRVRIHAAPACGSAAPPIPGNSCDVVQSGSILGESLGLARSDSGEYCALVKSIAADRRSEVLTAWSSSDGLRWTPTPGGAAIDLRGYSGVFGMGMTYSGTEFLAAAILYDRDSQRLALAHARTCADFSRLELGPTLAADTFSASYLVTNGRHEVYVIRNLTTELGPTLWRLSGSSQDELVLEPAPLAELPNNLFSPASISRVGSRDLVLLYPETLGSEHAGLAALVGSPDARSWQPLSQLLVSSQVGTFDATAPNAGSLSFDGQQGLILYSGTSAAGVRTGLARLWPSDAEAPPSAAEVCGDGSCVVGESCETCPVDCTCPGKVVAADVVSDGDQHWTTSSRSGRGSPYFDKQLGSLILQPTDSAWAERALDQPIIGDFELEADLTIPNSASNLHAYPPLDSLYFGVGTAPAGGVGEPEGVFARVTIFPKALGAGACFASDTDYALSPFVKTSAGTQSTLPIASADCPAGSRLLVPFAEPRHIELARRAGVISVTSFDQSGCPSSVSLEQTLPLPKLSSIVAGIYNTQPDAIGTGSAELSNMTLRLLADPASCPKGSTKCGERGEQGSCVDTETTPEHCGACGAVCQPGASCAAGTCTCTKERLDCPDECADGNRSALNCGVCGNHCQAHCLLGQCDVGEACADPKVLPPGPGSYDFDPSPAPADTTFCAGSQPIASDLFFAWTPTRTGRATVRLHGAQSRINTLLAVTADPACASYDPTWCNDDATGPGDESFLTLSVERGVSYYISADLALLAAPGPLTLSIEEK